MRYEAGWWSALPMAALLAAFAPAQGIDKWLQQAEALGARTGVVVRDEKGGVLFQRRGGEAFAPASNLKILTASAVLHGLGPDFEFKTAFRLKGGRLEVQASGDPNLITGSADAPDVVFAKVASALLAAGVHAVAGIDLQPGVFTGPGRPATWPQDQLETYYCAPTGPFVVDQGTFSMHVQAGDGAVDASIAAPLVDFGVQGSIAPAEAKKGAVWGAVDLGGAVKVNGHFYRKAAPATVRVAVRDPATWYHGALQRALAKAGIAVDPTAPARDAELPELKTPLQRALLRVLEDSSNFDAEQCLRVLGAHKGKDGSLAGGLAAGQRELEGVLGNLPPGVAWLDGSGLSKDNRVTPGLLVEALRAVLASPGRAMFLACMPVAAESGTLGKRFEHSPVAGRVFAKTGWIRGASALSGVLKRQDGSLRVFSILMNYDRDKGGLNKQLKELQEHMVEAMDEMPAGGSRP